MNNEMISEETSWSKKERKEISSNRNNLTLRALEPLRYQQQQYFMKNMAKALDSERPFLLQIPLLQNTHKKKEICCFCIYSSTCSLGTKLNGICGRDKSGNERGIEKKQTQSNRSAREPGNQLEIPLHKKVHFHSSSWIFQLNQSTQIKVLKSLPRVSLVLNY